MSGDSPTPTSVILRRLLAERGIHRFALFLVQQEGRMLPDGVEAISGFVLTDSDVYGFWLDWDEGRGDFALNPWYRVEDPSQLASDPEYQRAVAQLRLNQ